MAGQSPYQQNPRVSTSINFRMVLMISIDFRMVSMTSIDSRMILMKCLKSFKPVGLIVETVAVGMEEHGPTMAVQSIPLANGKW